MKKALLFGGASAIAQATARLMAQQGYQLFLVDMNEERLESIAKDLSVRGAHSVETYGANLCDFDKHEECINKALEFLGHIDIAAVFHGVLGDQEKSEQSVDEALLQITINGTSAVGLLSRVANLLEQQKHGSIVVMSSVAGERGRQSNYVYGSAMALKTVFLGGLAESPGQIRCAGPDY